jgi:putative transposase
VGVFPCIEAEKAGQRNVAKACCLLEVSRSAFYEWHKHVPSARQLADDELAQRIQAIWHDSKGTYGWPRVHRQLRRDGVHVSRKRVARIMRQKGPIGRCRRRWTRTTISDPGVVAVDLVRRAFGPGTVELDRVYVGDITYIWTGEGWAYLATVIDLASRRVVGWALADHMRAELVCDALRMAIDQRRPAPGLIFHSDRGTQLGVNGSSQRCLVRRSVEVDRGPRRVSPAEGLAWPRVERERNSVEVVTGVAGEVGALGEVLAQQAVGVLVGAPLPGAVRVAEEDVEPSVDAELGVLGHLGALVPGQRSAELLGQSRDHLGDCVSDGLCAVPRQRRAVLGPRFVAVAVHAGQVQQQREAGGSLDERARPSCRGTASTPGRKFHRTSRADIAAAAHR